MQKKQVLCAIDVNDYDQDVVDLAAEMAKQFGSSLELLHVTLFPNPIDAAAPAGISSHKGLEVDHVHLLDIKTDIEGVKVGHHHLSGFPLAQIVSFVDRNEPRLLVLGTHARDGFSWIVGSIAMKIMRKVTCPVMLLRQKKNSQLFGEKPAQA